MQDRVRSRHSRLDRMSDCKEQARSSSPKGDNDMRFQAIETLRSVLQLRHLLTEFPARAAPCGQEITAQSVADGGQRRGLVVSRRST